MIHGTAQMFVLCHYTNDIKNEEFLTGSNVGLVFILSWIFLRLFIVSLFINMHFAHHIRMMSRSSYARISSSKYCFVLYLFACSNVLVR